MVRSKDKHCCCWTGYAGCVDVASLQAALLCQVYLHFCERRLFLLESYFCVKYKYL